MIFHAMIFSSSIYISVWFDSLRVACTVLVILKKKKKKNEMKIKLYMHVHVKRAWKAWSLSTDFRSLTNTLEKWKKNNEEASDLSGKKI